MTPHLHKARHAVYRCWDAEGNLLYVGCTSNPPARVAAHHSRTPWWTEVASISIEWHADRASGLAAEKAAIQSEDPVHNFRMGRGQRQRKEVRTRAIALMRDRMFSNTRTLSAEEWQAIWGECQQQAAAEIELRGAA